MSYGKARVVFMKLDPSTKLFDLASEEDYGSLAVRDGSSLKP